MGNESQCVKSGDKKFNGSRHVIRKTNIFSTKFYEIMMSFVFALRCYTILSVVQIVHGDYIAISVNHETGSLPTACGRNTMRRVRVRRLLVCTL